MVWWSTNPPLELFSERGEVGRKFDGWPYDSGVLGGDDFVWLDKESVFGMDDLDWLGAVFVPEVDDRPRRGRPRLAGEELDLWPDEGDVLSMDDLDWLEVDLISYRSTEAEGA